MDDLTAISPPLNSTLDTAIGIASSGRTPYVLGGLAYAKNMGCLTVGIVCAKGSEMESIGSVDHLICIEVGAEVVTGSTRMKAGTGTKMVLNMISTGVMIRVGKTYGNSVRRVHLKLYRSSSIVMYVRWSI